MREDSSMKREHRERVKRVDEEVEGDTLSVVGQSTILILFSYCSFSDESTKSYGEGRKVGASILR